MPMTDYKYKVLHGFAPSAGQPAMMASALRSIGVDAFNVSIGYDKFSYPSDFSFIESGMIDRVDVLSEFGGLADIVHIHATTPYFNSGFPCFPMGTDLLALKAAGKKIVIHFRGSEIRVASIFRANNPYHYVDDDPDRLMKKFPEAGQLAYISLCRALADALVVSDPELATYVPDASMIPRVIDFETWSYVGVEYNRRPIVVHAPSRRGIKGTQYILDAVKALKREGLGFEFLLVENLSQVEARALLEKSDIVVDQLRIGWYGVLAVEAMALGKAVISYIRDDLLASFNGDVPVAVANPDTVKSVLRDLIVSYELRKALADRGYRYCLAVHDPIVVAEKCRDLYMRVLDRPQYIDFSGYMRINQRQIMMLVEGGGKSAKNAGFSIFQDLFSWSYLVDAYGFYRNVGFMRFLKRMIEKFQGL